MCLVEGEGEGVSEQRLWQFPQEELDEGGELVRRSVPQHRVHLGRRIVKIVV